MVQRIDIKPEMLAWAIQRAGYDVNVYLSEHPDVEAIWIRSMTLQNVIVTRRQLLS